MPSNPVELFRVQEKPAAMDAGFEVVTPLGEPIASTSNRENAVTVAQWMNDTLSACRAAFPGLRVGE